jgi:hypothetical protein
MMGHLNLMAKMSNMNANGADALLLTAALIRKERITEDQEEKDDLH